MKSILSYLLGEGQLKNIETDLPSQRHCPGDVLTLYLNTSTISMGGEPVCKMRDTCGDCL